MHDFSELIDRGTTFTIESLNRENERICKALQKSSATSLVKQLQMIQLQVAIQAVGMFSIFDGILQDGLSCKNGFIEAKKILNTEENIDLEERFNDFLLAINVLKHGRGRSYDALVLKAKTLPFRIMLPDESFFFEGDVSEISTLIEIDEKFINGCVEIIQEVSEIIRIARPEFVY